MKEKNHFFTNRNRKPKRNQQFFERENEIVK